MMIIKQIAVAAVVMTFTPSASSADRLVFRRKERA